MTGTTDGTTEESFVSRWWHAGDERSMLRCIGALGAPFIAWMGAVLTGLHRFDALTTDTPLSLTLKGTTALVVGLLAARAYFGPRLEVIHNPQMRAVRLRPGDWAFRGCLWTIMVSAVAFWFSSQFLQIAAQYASGPTVLYHGEVSKVEKAVSSRPACRVTLYVRVRDVPDDLGFCLRVKAADPIGPVDLVERDRVVVRTRRTVFGEAVHAVDDDSPERR